MSATHDHHHHHYHDHGHQHAPGGGARLLVALVVTLSFAFAEVIAGVWSGSLALLGDAGHMFTDASALGIAALASVIAKRPPTSQHSYGLLRAEAVAALFNGLFMVAIVVGIVIAAIDRLQNPQVVAGGTVMTIAALGLVINLVVAFVLSRGEHDLNTRGAMLHVLGDALGSVAAMIAGAVIYFGGPSIVDPILSMLICLLILFSALRLLRDVLNVIMEGVPAHLELRQVGMAMAGQEHVRSVHDLHIWTLASGNVALSAHVVLDDMAHWPHVLDAMRHKLDHDFHIEHVTLQPEVQQVTLHQIATAHGQH